MADVEAFPMADVEVAEPCWCCGQTGDQAVIQALQCHPEVRICGQCIRWLAAQAQERSTVHQAIPVLPTRNVTTALQHYAALGFATHAYPGGFYGFATWDSIEIHLASDTDVDAPSNHATVYLFVNDADALHARWVATVTDGTFTAPVDTDYGMREGEHLDPDGNIVRYGSPITTTEPS